MRGKLFIAIPEGNYRKLWGGEQMSFVMNTSKPAFSIKLSSLPFLTEFQPSRIMVDISWHGGPVFLAVDNGGMRSSKNVETALAPVIFMLAACAVPALSQQQVREIRIHSGWGGLGAPRSSDVTVQWRDGVFLRGDGKAMEPALIQNLVEALRADPNPKPELNDLGITSDWLKTHLQEAEQKMPVGMEGALPSQRQLFDDSFRDAGFMASVVPALFSYVKLDDYPSARVEISFDDGSKLEATSHSYYAYMIPWNLGQGAKSESWNAAISRAVSALTPEKCPNKERLAGDGLATELADALMRRIEDQWKMRGVEGRAGSALAALRSAYMVERADINPYHDVYFGKKWKPRGPHETNLQVTLNKASFPANFREHLVLEYDQSKVQGLDEFLRNGAKYEALALSIPWLNQYLDEHPRETLTLMYVHHASFGDHAMESFASDMKASGREDLIPAVRAEKSEIALFKVGYVYWLLFPDQHMILWRFEGPSGFLKWKEEDFPSGNCADYYRVNHGGCPGSEISPDGVLVPGR